MSTEWPRGVDRLILPETDSTNAAGLRHRGGPAWILAHRQTAGRGRRGRTWESPPGNFAASLVFDTDLPPGQAALYSFVAALALHDVLAAVTDRPLTLKWPNDVLLGGGKVAGILLESTGTAARVERLVVGFGVNLVAAPPVTEPGASSPVALGWEGSPEDFLDRLAPTFAARDRRFRAEGFAPIRAAWLAHAERLGQPVTARTGSKVRSGRFSDIDATGALVLATDGGTRAIAAAEVYF